MSRLASCFGAFFNKLLDVKFQLVVRATGLESETRAAPQQNFACCWGRIHSSTQVF